MDEKLYSSDDEHLKVWIEQDTSIHLKAVTDRGDPVELTENDARQLEKILLQYADYISQ